MAYVMRLRAAWAVLILVLGLAMLGPAPARAQVEINLRDADLRSFVQIVSEATGRSYVLDPNVRGTVTVLAPGDMTPDELFEVFLVERCPRLVFGCYDPVDGDEHWRSRKLFGVL